MKPWLKGALWTLAFMPPALVLHEAAHYAGYIIYNLPNPTLSYAFGGFEGMRDYWIMLREGDREAADAIAPIFDVGIAALLGPLITFILGAIGLLFLISRQSIIGGALAVAAFWRFAAIALLYILGRPEHTDEAHIAITLAIPDIPIVLIGNIALIYTVWRLWKLFGWQVILGIVAGLAVSTVLWMQLLGPILLP